MRRAGGASEPVLKGAVIYLSGEHAPDARPTEFKIFPGISQI
jgi:hypothetical protein